MRKQRLEFGLNCAIPKGKKACWGARLIYPDQLLRDRIGADWKDNAGEYTPAGSALREWLNGGALAKALERARKVFPFSHAAHGLDPANIKTMYEDETGVIQGCPAGGYVYVAAWLKNEPK